MPANVRWDLIRRLKVSLLTLLLPLWAVRPIQNLGACTRVHFTLIFTFSYP